MTNFKVISFTRLGSFRQVWLEGENLSSAEAEQLAFEVEESPHTVAVVATRWGDVIHFINPDDLDEVNRIRRWFKPSAVPTNDNSVRIRFTKGVSRR